MGMFETMVGYNPDSPIKGLPEFISKEKQAAIALEQEKYKLEIHKAELENKKSELAQKNNDYFWKALETASKYKGPTRKNILKAIPSIIKQQTGKDVSPEVANAFNQMMSEGESGQMADIDFKKGNADPNYRMKIIQTMQEAYGLDSIVEATNLFNAVMKTEQEQQSINARALGQLEVEKAKQDSNKETLDIKEQIDYRKDKRASFDKVRAQARTLGVFKDDPEWYVRYVEAKPDEQLKMESELDAEVGKRALVSDKAARAALDKQIGMALKYASPAEAGVIRKLSDPNANEEVKALANDTLNSVLGRSGNAESAKQSNEVSRGSLGNAKAAIDLGGGEGLAPDETKGLVGGRVTPAEQKAIETAQQRKMQNAAKKANKAASGMTPNQKESLISRLYDQAKKVDDPASVVFNSATKLRTLLKDNSGVNDAAAMATFQSLREGIVSVFKEGEEKALMRTAGLVDSIENMAKSVANGQKLSSNQKNAMRKVADEFEKIYLRKYKGEMGSFINRAKSNGLNPEEVLSPLMLERISKSKNIESVDNIRSGKKVLKKIEMINYLRSKGKSEAQINSTIEKMKSDGARFE